MGLRQNLRFARAARRFVGGGEPFAQLRMACELEATPLDIPPRAFGRFGRMSAAAEIAVRQRLVSFLVYRWVLPAFMSHLASAGTRTVLPLPPAWRRRSAQLGVRLDRARSWLMWVGVLLALYARGIHAGARLFSLSARGKLPMAPAAPYSVLVGLSRSNLPPAGVDQPHDMVSWYRRSPIKPQDASVVWAHIPSGGGEGNESVTVSPHYFPAIEGGVRHLVFASRVLAQCVATLGRMLLGRWWEAVLHEQAVELLYAQTIPRGALARSYVFNNAAFVVRPLWTYWAEAQGAEIVLVFYATNLEPFGSDDARASVWPGYRGMTWPRYAAWDRVQADWLAELGHGSSDIVVVGDVGFTDGVMAADALPAGPFIAVFDVTPQHPVSLALRGIPQPYYTSEATAQFMRDLADLFHRRGVAMVQKRKKEIGRGAAPRYRSFLKELSREAHVYAVDPSVAPHRVIARAKAVVSMPFTSTALIAREMGVPSVYYDPLGAVTHELRLARGIPILGSRDALESWLDSLPALSKT